MSSETKDSFALIFGVIGGGVYLIITVVVLLKLCVQYIRNRNKPEEENWEGLPGSTNIPASFIYGIQPNQQRRAYEESNVEPPPDFSTALTCPSPTSIAYIELNEGLPSYSDYESLYAAVSGSGLRHEEQINQNQNATAAPITFDTENLRRVE